MATQTVAFLFCGIEGPTVLPQHGNAYVGALADCRRLLRAVLVAHGGEEVASRGDGFAAVFA